MLLNLGNIARWRRLLFSTMVLLLPMSLHAQFIIDTVEIPCGESHLLVSEILFNPVPGGVDYVELFNPDSSPVSLSGLVLAGWSDGVLRSCCPLPDSVVVAPKTYVVFTADAAFVLASYQVRYPSQLFELHSLPSFNDAKGMVIVATKDSVVIDRLDYTESMHNSILRNVEGVALERRSFSVPASKVENWTSAASTSGFGTPTGRNSQQREFFFSQDDFSVTPAVFSPDGDGYNDQVDVLYNLSEPGLLCDLKVFDAAGNLVRNLMRNGILGEQGFVTWNGTDETGQRLRRGNYVVVVDVFNNQGKHQCSKYPVALILK